MLYFSWIITLCLSCASGRHYGLTDSRHNDHTPAWNTSLSLEIQWQKFKTIHGKQYGSEQEELRRRRVFTHNLLAVRRHNALYATGQSSFMMEINKFADMDPNEMSRLMTGYLAEKSNVADKMATPYTSATWRPHQLPDTVDWRTKGYVTPVKNQRACGSCWAFSVTGSIEGQHKKKTGRLVSVSEQDLVDCSTHNHGCKGGNQRGAYLDVIREGGIDTEGCYPYSGRQGKCHFNKTCVGARLTGYTHLPRKNEAKLQEALALVGPISVAICACGRSFMLYKKGVHDDPHCPDHINHGVLVVGYGTEAGHDYWLVKNSWGTRWGDHGYIKMARNKKNQCGIANQGTYPNVAAKP